MLFLRDILLIGLIFCKAPAKAVCCFPFLFLCFTDDLLEVLCRCPASLKISNHVIGCPAVCDDLLLASLSKRGLDELMRICFNNSCKWHFSYMYGTPELSHDP